MNFYDCCDLTKKSIFNAGTQVSLHITWYIVQYVFTVQYLLPLCAYCCICSTHRMVFWLQRHTLQQLSSSYRNWNLLIACTATMIKRVADKCICSSSHTSDRVETEREREETTEKRSNVQRPPPMAIIFMGMNLDLEFLLYCQFLCVAAFCCCCSLSRRACSIVLAIRQFVALPSLYIFGHFKEIQWCPRDIFCIFQVNAVWCCALLHCRYCLLHILLLLFWILKSAFHHTYVVQYSTVL